MGDKGEGGITVSLKYHLSSQTIGPEASVIKSDVLRKTFVSVEW